MKRVAWILTVVGILFASTGAAQAHDWYHGHGGPHHGGVAVVVRSPVVVAPRVVMPVPPPPMMYGPAYRPVYPYPYRCHEPVPSGGVYFRGRGVSFGIGW
jgi:hypothetical protein